MKEVDIYNVIDKVAVSAIKPDRELADGDPVEIDHEMYYVCERKFNPEGEIVSIGVIPLVVRDPRKVKDINKYLGCLSVAHRRVRFRKENRACDFEDCDEMIIS